MLCLDADTRPAPGLTAAALAAACAEGADALSVAPRFIVETAGERWLHPALLTTLIYRLGGGAMSPTHRGFVNGQCLLLRAEAVRRAGCRRSRTSQRYGESRFRRGGRRANGAEDAMDGEKQLSSVVFGRVERSQLELAFLVLHQQLDLLLDLGKLLIAELHQPDAVFERGERIFERQLARFEPLNDLLELFHRCFEFLFFRLLSHALTYCELRLRPWSASRSSGSMRAPFRRAPQ
jgi:hypothetical protein